MMTLISFRDPPARLHAGRHSFISCPTNARTAVWSRSLNVIAAITAVALVELNEPQHLARVIAGTAASALLAAVGWVARRKLPVGAGYGMLVGGVTAATLIGYLPKAAIQPPELRIAMLFAAASALLPIAVRALAKRPADQARSPSPAASELPSLPRIALHCSVIFGVVAAAAVVALLDQYADHAPAVAVRTAATVVIAALMLACGVAGFLRANFAGYAAAAGGGALVWIWTRLGCGAPTAGQKWTLLATAIIALCASLLPNYRRWQERRRAWLTDPMRLCAAPPDFPGVDRFVLALCVLIGGATFSLAGSPAATYSAALGGIAALGVTHRSRQRDPDLVDAVLRNEHGGLRRFPLEMGLALCGLAIALAVTRMAPAPISFWLGATLGALWLLWLAKFWQQQLLDGRPWTTAGALIPAARRLGIVGASATLAFALAWRFDGAPPPALWIACVLVIGNVLMLRMLVRSAHLQSDPLAALAAGFAASAAAVALDGAALAAFEMRSTGLWICGGAALLLAALRPRMTSHEPEAISAAYNAQVAGLFPAAALVLAAGATPALEWVEIALCTLCFALAITLRGGARRVRGGPAAV